MSQVLVLANSAKTGGRCVAGIDLQTDQWVRPISATASGSLTGVQTLVSWAGSRTQAAPLDVVEMDLGDPRPTVHHPEDVLVDLGNWAGIEQRTAIDLLDSHGDLFDDGPTLLGDGSDHLTLSEITALGDMHRSLTMARPGEVAFVVQTNSFSGRRSIRAQFFLHSQFYDLAVTDMRCSLDDLPRKGDYILTISLALPWKPDWSTEPLCYKLVAGITPIK